MKQYIDKAALVAEIERLVDSHKALKTLDPTYYEGLVDSLDDVLSFLDTLEVKEVNSTDAVIEKAAEWLNNFYNEDTHSYLISEDIKKFINYMKGE